jgi:predicted ATP-grasp superfamily ATP-dependent carboligase
MNMFYTGLGIARSLGERGIPVIGLTAKPIYGNYTRYAEVRQCPDSRELPEQLLPFLLHLGKALPSRAVIFPTRDDDVLFLDRHRDLLTPHFELAIPSTGVVAACLDKWETYVWATKVGIDTPRSWITQTREELARVAGTVTYPCVMKPLSSHLWRQHDNWQRVGARKAVRIDSSDVLASEYHQISEADPRVLIQELVQGSDDQLFVAACYLDRSSTLVAAFTARKLLQIPAGFGTGCIVETVDRPQLIALAAKLLQGMGFTGIAEVEFKWDAADETYKLIEINPRPWDQHSLGRVCGVDLIHFAYCEYAELPQPPVQTAVPGHKWIAEDAFLMAVLRMLWTRDSSLRSLFALARGKRTYGIWSRRDKKPFVMYLSRVIPQVAWTGLRWMWAMLGRWYPKGLHLAYKRELHDAKIKD